MFHAELLSPSPDCFCYQCQARAGIEGFITAEMFIQSGTMLPTAYYCGDLQAYPDETLTTAPIEAESVSDLFKDFDFDKTAGSPPFMPIWNPVGMSGTIQVPALKPFTAVTAPQYTSPIQCAECGHTLPSHWPSCSVNYRMIPSVTSPRYSSVQDEFEAAQDTAYNTLS